jgi:peptidoglycan/LPS O-acetylase OafA/YrhL
MFEHSSTSSSPGVVPSLAAVYDRRRNNFDVLRFGLATAVIWSHCYALAGRSMDPVFALTGQIDAGSLAVEAFFVLSGFLITQSWDGDPDLRSFTSKRTLRLVPALVAALVFGTRVVGPLATPCRSPTTSRPVARGPTSAAWRSTVISRRPCCSRTTPYPTS